MEGTMGAHESRSEHGPSWGDVLTFLDDLRETYGGHTRVEITPQALTRWGDRRGLWCRVVWKEDPNKPHSGERAGGGGWPTPEHRTMPGLLYKLCHELERKMEGLAHDNAMAGGWQPSDGALHDLAPRHPQPTKKRG
jgi:hypothetical protein